VTADGNRSPPDRRTPTDSLGQSSRRVKHQARRLPVSGVLAPALRPTGGGGVLRRPADGLPRFPPPLSRSALRARDALVLEHLPLADAIASTAARRLFPLVEREDLIQVAREALVRSAPCCRASEPAAPYLRRCIAGALQHRLRDRVRLVRISRREHEKGTCPLGHASLDAAVAGDHSLLEQLASPEPQWAVSSAADRLALERLVEQLPAAQAIALRLTVLEGLSLRAAAQRLEISDMSVQRAQKKAIAYLRLQLVGGG